MDQVTDVTKIAHPHRRQPLSDNLPRSRTDNFRSWSHTGSGRAPLYTGLVGSWPYLW